MNVQPAASIPPLSLRNPNGQVVIVNLQRTPYDHLATIRVFGKCDEFMRLVMQELEIGDFDHESDCIGDWDAKDDDDDDDTTSSSLPRLSVLQWTSIAIASFSVLVAAVLWRYPDHW
jgi:hypothetical protein